MTADNGQGLTYRWCQNDGHILQRHLILASVLDDENEMTTQGAQQAVVLQGKKADKPGEFADPLLRVGKVCKFDFSKRIKSERGLDVPMD